MILRIQLERKSPSKIKKLTADLKTSGTCITHAICVVNGYKGKDVGILF